MSSLLPEETLLLLLCRRSPPSVVSFAQYHPDLKNIGTGFDHERFLSLALRNGVAPLVYSNLKKSGLFPPAYVYRFSKVYADTFASNFQQYVELKKILQILGQNGIDVIPLKGVTAGETIFQDFGLYPSSDIDILVRTADVHKAGGILREHGGYALAPGLRLEELVRSHYHLNLCNAHHLVELHWNLVKRYFAVPPDYWWEGIRKGELLGQEITELEPEKYILYLAFRLFDHQFVPLKFLVLAAEVTRSHPDLNWEKLMGYAKKYGMERLVLFVLKLNHDLLEVALPGEMVRSLRGYACMKNTVMKDIFSEPTSPHLRTLYYSFFLLPLPRFCGVLAGRLFPPASEICLRYGLHEGSWKIYLYYFLNPFLMIFRRKRR